MDSVSLEDLQKKWEKNLRTARKDLESLKKGNGHTGGTAIRVHYMEQIVKDLNRLGADWCTCVGKRSVAGNECTDCHKPIAMREGDK